MFRNPYKIIAKYFYFLIKMCINNILMFSHSLYDIKIFKCILLAFLKLIITRTILYVQNKIKNTDVGSTQVK